VTAPNRGTLWARALADELARHGLRHVSVGSGSRSAPLVEAFTRDERFAVHPHVDERSAGFFALGIGLATGTPAAVVTTSGTAAANLFPAVIEASHGDVPLLLLTADRPARLRGLDANQTIEQAGMYGGAPRVALDLPVPSGRPEDLRLLRIACARAWAAALTPPAGPAHLNLQFEKPLEPTPVPGDVAEDVGSRPGLGGAREDGRPYTAVWFPDEVAAAAVAALAGRLTATARPVVVCGPAVDPALGPAALGLARALGAPLLADPLSGARFAEGAVGTAVSWADAVLARPAARDVLAADVVVRLGAAPTSAAVNAYLAGLEGVPQVVVDRGRRWKDHAGLASEYVEASPTRWAAAVSARIEAPVADPAWRASWAELEGAAGAALRPFVEERWFEGSVAAAVAGSLAAGQTFFVGNSMPIRDVDAFAAARDVPLRALGFRGASGIDGNVSGALGAATARPGPAAAIVGDLTLLHDAGALLAARPEEARLTLVVIQNGGGGIFHMLPIRDYDPPFTRHIVMPQPVELAAVARAARIPHRLSATLAELRAALAADGDAPGVRMLEVPVDRHQNWDVRRAALEAAAQAVTDRL